MRLIQELKRRNVFKVAVAYLALGWIVVQVTALAVPALNLPRVLNPIVFYLGLVGFPFALFFAWAFELTPEGVRKTSAEDTPEGSRGGASRGLRYLVIGLMAVALAWFAFDKFKASGSAPADAEEVRDPTIAVLPFVDMSEGGENQYLGDGIAEEILNGLVAVPGLKVASRTSSFSYRGDSARIEDIGHTLKVRHVLEGSIRRSGNRLRVTAQLIDVQTGYHLFSRQLDRQSDDLFGIQDEIAREIVRTLRPTLGLPDSVSVVRRLNASPEAQELRMKARYAFFNATQNALDDAVNYMNHALVLEPKFWLARGELAYAYLYRAFYIDHVLNSVNAAEQATITLEHEPDNGPALLVRAALLSMVEFDQAAARKIYDRLLSVGIPDRSILMLNYSALYLNPHGAYDRAIEMLLDEETRNPRAGNLKLGLTQAYIAKGDYARAAEELEQLRAISGDVWAIYQFGARVLLEQGKAQQALELAQAGRKKFGLSPQMLLRTMVEAYLKLGREDDARALVAEADRLYSEGKPVWAASIAYGYVMLGDYAAAGGWLNRSLELREPQLLFIISFLRQEEGFNRSPEFTKILQEMNLPLPAEIKP